jgi:hypothetical protein
VKRRCSSAAKPSHTRRAFPFSLWIVIVRLLQRHLSCPQMRARFEASGNAPSAGCAGPCRESHRLSIHSNASRTHNRTRNPCAVSSTTSPRGAYGSFVPELLSFPAAIRGLMLLAYAARFTAIMGCTRLAVRSAATALPSVPPMAVPILASSGCAVRCTCSGRMPMPTA